MGCVVLFWLMFGFIAMVLYARIDTNILYLEDGFIFEAALCLKYLSIMALGPIGFAIVIHKIYKEDIDE